MVHDPRCYVLRAHVARHTSHKPVHATSCNCSSAIRRYVGDKISSISRKVQTKLYGLWVHSKSDMNRAWASSTGDFSDALELFGARDRDESPVICALGPNQHSNVVRASVSKALPGVRIFHPETIDPVSSHSTRESVSILLLGSLYRAFQEVATYPTPPHS